MTAIGSRSVQESARRLVPVHRAPWAATRARTSLRDRTVRLGAQETASLDQGALWQYGDERARGRHGHGFTFLVDWTGAVPRLEAPEASALTDLVVELFTDWDVRYGQRRDTSPEMAFHDETTAQRLLGLTGVLDQFDFSAEQRELLTGLAGRTAEVLREPAFYAGVNNHGMFQDLALLAWASLVADPEDPAQQESWDLAEGRLHEYFSECFTFEGVHVENTPTYHVMVSRYLPVLDELFTRAGSPSAEQYHRLLAGAASYAIHSVTPAALYPPVSDTHQRRLDTEQNLETFPGGEFEYAVTGGRQGRCPAKRTATFEASGYAMTRSAWADATASYVYFSCAYNADYHKHSDENSVYLRSGGRDLLSEAGAYGYNWKDPFTKYAYSSAAHNTLVVNGTGLPRTEPVKDRIEADPPLDQLIVHNAEDDQLDVTGTTRRFRGRVWDRRLKVQHGEMASSTRLHIEDSVTSETGYGDLRFLWHLGPGLRVRLRSDGFEVFDRLTKVMEMRFSSASMLSLRLLEGAEVPSIQGWSFPDFGKRVPSPVIMVESRAANLRMDTEVRLDDFLWDEDETGTLETPMINTRTVPTASTPSTTKAGLGSVLFLSPYSEESDRERLVAELVRAGLPVRYVPDVSGRVAGAGSAEQTKVAVEQLAAAAEDHVIRERENGNQVTVAAVGHAFAPAAIAAFSTGAPLIALDPRLSFCGREGRTARLSARLKTLIAEGVSDVVDVVSSSDAPAEVDRALTALGEVVSIHRNLRGLLRADVEDMFSDLVLNSIHARSGEATLRTAAYDRRTKAFLVEVPLLTDVEVSVRVFHGKKQVHALPYTPGSKHRIPFMGSGPHRLRVHVRGTKSQEAVAFTTGTIRVR